MATLPELEQALAAADAAGDTAGAQHLAGVIQRAIQDKSNLIPDVQIPETIVQAPDATIGENIVGAGETALTLGTGAVGGTLGMLGGTLKGLAEQILSGNFGTREAARAVEQAAIEGAGSLTYAPRTQAGQEMAQATGEVLQQAIPATVMPGEMAAVANATRLAAPAARAGAETVAAPVVASAKQAVQNKIKPPTPGTPGSTGAMAVDIADVRQAKAGELPVPIKLTEGQKTRSFEQQRFERETAKDPALGDPIRQRFADQNLQLQQNMDSFIDMTGAEAPDLRSIGLSVDSALRSRAARDKTKIRTLYKDAEKAGEMEAPVTLDTTIQHLIENAPEAEVSNVLKAVKAKALQLGVATEDASGNLVAQPVSLKTAELFRKSINASTNAEPTNIRQASIMKGLIDDSTEGLGGQAYKRARAARVQYANDYENVGLVKNLIGQKRGSNDRAIAMEDVLKRSIIDPGASLDSVRHVRKLLQTEGEKGAQAWKELQGGTLKYLKDEATKNVARDELGNPIVSASQLDRVITNLDKSGKLDFIFGKKGAEQLRVINDVAKDVLTSPPGAVNTSNTASVVLAAMDMALSGMAGLPLPVLSGIKMLGRGVKDSKTKARVKKALGE